MFRQRKIWVQFLSWSAQKKKSVCFSPLIWLCVFMGISFPYRQPHGTTMTISLSVRFLFVIYPHLTVYHSHQPADLHPRTKQHSWIAWSRSQHFLISSRHWISCHPPLLASFSVAQGAHLLPAFHIACPICSPGARLRCTRAGSLAHDAPCLSLLHFFSGLFELTQVSFQGAQEDPGFCLVCSFSVKTNPTFITAIATGVLISRLGLSGLWQLVQGNYAHLVFHLIVFRPVTELSECSFWLCPSSWDGQLRGFPAACIPGASQVSPPDSWRWCPCLAHFLMGTPHSAHEG